ncbi:uncharacterized protein Z518_09673 [Rhinocladiella mackenziei CBS 650.93]|uniref:Uncharacterized protein n=1 Tax=Rhinocladiella mackenziei CBS 650.93 TaxID=1442369 RepID=A0A0D2GQN8_9EURO|nr:uncharacterized protein Z518_09673 [Rhinocladiella mackenziei CBS 650.93]KIX00608.1 hypothetical protein Z518_09673 [Rhinocladiella mackenziei CBS 650.93]
MPTILTPQGWVKVSQIPGKRPANHDPAEALKGPLAYFSCQPLPSSKVPNGARNKPQFPYDLSASPEKLKRQSHARIGGKNRNISAPQPRLEDDDEDEDADRKSHSSRSSLSTRSVSPAPELPRSHHSSKSRHQCSHDEGRSKSGSSRSPHRSYSHHPPIETNPQPVVAHSSGPGQYHPRNSYNNYSPPGSFQRPPPPTNARSMSYSWYNATTPLNL